MSQIEESERVAVERRIAHMETTLKAHGQSTTILIDAHQKHMDEKIAHLEQRMDERMAMFNQRMDERFQGLLDRFDRLLEETSRPKPWGAIIAAVGIAIPVFAWLINATVLEPKQVQIDDLERRVDALESE